MSAAEGDLRKRSLVDSAEEALRNWLAPGRHRPGDRLPPEHDLASMLGISRGTLRSALQRLDDTGEIVRRQGSGTFVGRMPQSAAFHEGLEKLVPYSSLARRRGVKLSTRDVVIEERVLDTELARLFAVPEGATAPLIRRTLLADGTPTAVMVDTVHPDVPLPAEPKLRRALERGDMVLDVLLAQSVPVAFCNTHIRARLVTPRERLGQALGVTRTTAVLDLEETFHLTSGGVSHHSMDLFAPGGLDLGVSRWLDAGVPAVGGEDAGNGRTRKAGRARR